MALLSTNNKCFGWDIRKLFFNYTLLSKEPDSIILEMNNNDIKKLQKNNYVYT